MIDRIAHRGASLEAPENTMQAFSTAYQKGATHIECDVRLTADKVPIIIHDDTLERTTNGKGPVDKCRYQVIETLDAGSWFNDAFSGTAVPKLSELLCWQKKSGVTLHLEIKPLNPNTLDADLDIILEQVHALADTQKIHLLSFQYAVLKRLQKLNNHIPTVLAITRCQSQDIENAIAANCHQINSSYDHVCPKQIKNIQNRGLRVGIYTVNQDEQIKELVHYHVDAVFVDDMHLINSPTLHLGL